MSAELNHTIVWGRFPAGASASPTRTGATNLLTRA